MLYQQNSFHQFYVQSHLVWDTFVTGDNLMFSYEKWPKTLSVVLDFYMLITLKEIFCEKAFYSFLCLLSHWRCQLLKT